MMTIKEEVLTWFDNLVFELYKRDQKILKRQKWDALMQIETIKARFEKAYSVYEHELFIIEKQMMPYVKKMCFMPLSFYNMINDWTEKLKKGNR